MIPEHIHIPSLSNGCESKPAPNCGRWTYLVVFSVNVRQPGRPSSMTHNQTGPTLDMRPGTPPLATFSAGDPALDHTICRLEVFHAGRGRTEHVVFAIWCFHTGREVEKNYSKTKTNCGHTHIFQSSSLRRAAGPQQTLQRPLRPVIETDAHSVSPSTSDGKPPINQF